MSAAEVDDERILVCTRCEDLVWVVELPDRYLDPATFVCLECRKERGERGDS